DFTIAYMKEHMEKIAVHKPEGTYLVWLDCRGLGMDAEALKQWMYHEAKVALSDGSVFGREGAGFLRLNIACPRATLAEGLQRMHLALERHGGK
ncbi:aminotransferase, partial [Microbacteriaceae bacterium K1510]|nr:aminotransferase [Microbacteriaceae bacterium K1510]